MQNEIAEFYHGIAEDGSAEDLQFKLADGGSVSRQELVAMIRRGDTKKFNPDPIINGTPMHRVTLLQVDRLPRRMRPPGLILEHGRQRYLLINNFTRHKPEPSPSEKLLAHYKQELFSLGMEPDRKRRILKATKWLEERVKALPGRRKAQFEDKIIKHLERIGCGDVSSISELPATAKIMRRDGERGNAADLWVKHQDFRTWDDLLALPLAKKDENALISPATRFLSKGGSFLIVAPSGVGKSTLIMQMAISWAAGRDFFGLHPARPLRCFLLQGENDDGDVAEMAQGIKQGLELTAHQEKLLRDNFTMQSMFGVPDKGDQFDKTGNPIKVPFHELLEELVTLHKPDVFFVDPLFAFLSGDFNSQEFGSENFRRRINPVLKDTGCILVSTHHTPKPAREKTNTGGVDYSYSGFGTSELTNWYRAVATLRVEKGLTKTFRFVIAKRGARAGFVGGINYCLMKHSEKKLFWEKVDRPYISPRDKRFDKIKADELNLMSIIRSEKPEPRSEFIARIMAARKVKGRQAANYWRRIKKHFEKVSNNKYIFIPPTELKSKDAKKKDKTPKSVRSTAPSKNTRPSSSGKISHTRKKTAARLRGK